MTDCKSLNQVRTENLFISLHRWFLKSEAESFLVSDRKPACVFPIHFGKCNTQMGLSLGKARKSPRCFEGVRKIQRFKNGFSGTFEAPDLHLRLTFLRLPATLYSALPDTFGCDLVLYQYKWIDWLIDIVQFRCILNVFSSGLFYSPARGTCLVTQEYDAEGWDELSVAPADCIHIMGVLVSCFDWFTGRKESTGEVGLVKTSVVRPSPDTYRRVCSNTTVNL